ncbi:hypothetical protein GEMRC1_011341 [Eukaryota sp. GEM-RC1]
MGRTSGNLKYSSCFHRHLTISYKQRDTSSNAEIQANSTNRARRLTQISISQAWQELDKNVVKRFFPQHQEQQIMSFIESLLISHWRPLSAKANVEAHELEQRHQHALTVLDITDKIFKDIVLSSHDLTTPIPRTSTAKKIKDAVQKFKATTTVTRKL